MSPLNINRHRLALQMLNIFGGPVSNTDFQALLFLFTQKYQGEKPWYEFVPHRFGAFSYTCAEDKQLLTGKRLLVKNDHYWQLAQHGRIQARQQSLVTGLNLFKEKYGHVRGQRLLIDQYSEYPFYATRSEILEQVLPDWNLRQPAIRARAPVLKGGVITIGVLSDQMESLLNTFLQHSVTLVCDMRDSTPRTQEKFSHACKNLGLRYEIWAHHLDNHAATDTDMASVHDSQLATVMHWLESGFRVGLVGGETDTQKSRRHNIAAALGKLYENRMQKLETITCDPIPNC